MFILSLVWPLKAPSSCLLLFRNQDLGVKCAHCNLSVTAPRLSQRTELGKVCIDTDIDIDIDIDTDVDVDVDGYIHSYIYLYIYLLKTESRQIPLTPV